MSHTNLEICISQIRGILKLSPQACCADIVAKLRETKSVADLAGEALTAGLGNWIPVTEQMPDDEITVLVWDQHLQDATMAYHDHQVLEQRKDSGWLMADGSGRVLIGVSHFCGSVRAPL